MLLQQTLKILSSCLFVFSTEMVEFGDEARAELGRQVEDLRETLRKERIGAITTELSIDAENECLKFDVNSLTSTNLFIIFFMNLKIHSQVGLCVSDPGSSMDRPVKRHSESSGLEFHSGYTFSLSHY